MDVGMQKSNLNPKLNELSNFRSEFSSPTKITLTLKNLPPQLLALSSNKIINTNIGDQGSFTFSPDGKTLAVNKSVNESTPFEVYKLSSVFSPGTTFEITATEFVFDS
jgi:hypothetical protein